MCLVSAPGTLAITGSVSGVSLSPFYSRPCTTVVCSAGTVLSRTLLQLQTMQGQFVRHYALLQAAHALQQWFALRTQIPCAQWLMTCKNPSYSSAVALSRFVLPLESEIRFKDLRFGFRVSLLLVSNLKLSFLNLVGEITIFSS